MSVTLLSVNFYCLHNYLGDALDGTPVRDLESWDVQFPWQLSELSAPNESGLIPVRVSEVSIPSSSQSEVYMQPRTQAIQATRQISDEKPWFKASGILLVLILYICKTGLVY